jgi:hypothetical protein
MPKDKPELGKIAYEAFWHELLPLITPYETVPENIQEAWQRAAKAVITYTSQ